MYAYDANGNRISEKFENSANNQLTSDGKFRYHYDDEGNRVKKVSLATGESTQYVWDHRNRLIQVKTPKEAVNYVYDFRNRLVKRNDEFFVHDEWQIVASLKNNKVAHRYLWGANQDELLVADDAWTLGDHLNSIRDIIDATGKVVSHREYNAFGKVTRATGNFDCVFGYTGKMFDTTTALQWNINRWYDAEVGRWTSEDPIGFEGEGVNINLYVQNSPVIFRDTQGLIKWNTAKDTGNDTAPWPTSPSITGDLYTVQTDAGRAVDAWKPHNTLQANGGYWCHGYTFGGHTAPGGPFSFWGNDVPKILTDDNWVPNWCCTSSGGIAVFYNASGVSHSGIIASVDAPNGRFLESSTLTSKWGQGPLSTASFATNVASYGNYKCYVKASTAKPGCCIKGDHEIC